MEKEGKLWLCRDFVATITNDMMPCSWHDRGIGCLKWTSRLILVFKEVPAVGVKGFVPSCFGQPTLKRRWDRVYGLGV